MDNRQKWSKDWRQKEKRMIEDEMVGWHHRFSGRQFKQTPGGGEGQGSLACCSPWGLEESNMTWWLNNDNQGPAVQRRELCSMLCGSPDGRGVWGRMDTCICMAEPFCCPPETVTTLLTNYSPTLNRKLKKKQTNPSFILPNTKEGHNFGASVIFIKRS